MSHKYKVGEKVLLNGHEVTIEQTGININKQPLYRIGELWYKENELEEWFPPCPL